MKKSLMIIHPKKTQKQNRQKKTQNPRLDWSSFLNKTFLLLQSCGCGSLIEMSISVTCQVHCRPYTAVSEFLETGWVYHRILLLWLTGNKVKKLSSIPRGEMGRGDSYEMDQWIASQTTWSKQIAKSFVHFVIHSVNSVVILLTLTDFASKKICWTCYSFLLECYLTM